MDLICSAFSIITNPKITDLKYKTEKHAEACFSWQRTLTLIEIILRGCNFGSEGVHFDFRGGALYSWGQQ